MVAGRKYEKANFASILKEIIKISLLSMNFVYSSMMILLIWTLYFGIFYARLANLTISGCPAFLSYFSNFITFTFLVDFITAYFSLLMFLNLIAYTQKRSPLQPLRSSAKYIGVMAVWMLAYAIFVNLPALLLSSSSSQLACLSMHPQAGPLGASYVIQIPPILFQSIITFLTPLIFYYKVGPLKALSILIGMARKSRYKATRRNPNRVIERGSRFVRENISSIVVLVIIAYAVQFLGYAAFAISNFANLGTAGWIEILNGFIVLWLPLICGYSFVIGRHTGLFALFSSAAKRQPVA